MLAEGRLEVRVGNRGASIVQVTYSITGTCVNPQLTRSFRDACVGSDPSPIMRLGSVVVPFVCFMGAVLRKAPNIESRDCQSKKELCAPGQPSSPGLYLHAALSPRERSVRRSWGEPRHRPRRRSHARRYPSCSEGRRGTTCRAYNPDRCPPSHRARWYSFRTVRNRRHRSMREWAAGQAGTATLGNRGLRDRLVDGHPRVIGSNRTHHVGRLHRSPGPGGVAHEARRRRVRGAVVRHQEARCRPITSSPRRKRVVSECGLHGLHGHVADAHGTNVNPPSLRCLLPRASCWLWPASPK